MIFSKFRTHGSSTMADIQHGVQGKGLSCRGRFPYKCILSPEGRAPDGVTLTPSGVLGP
jgi:hypothetical protein